MRDEGEWMFWSEESRKRDWIGYPSPVVVYRPKLPRGTLPITNDPILRGESCPRP